MKINKNSWHYKLVVAGDNTASKNLCVYFWQIVLRILTLLFYVIIVAPFLIFLALTPFINLFVGMAGMQYFGAGLDILVLSAILYILIKDRIEMERLEGKKPSLATTWIMAKKSKICPRIEFE